MDYLSVGHVDRAIGKARQVLIDEKRYHQDRENRAFVLSLKVSW